MDILIRQAREEDALAIADAERKIAEEPGIFCSLPAELADETVLQTILSFKQKGNGIYLVAVCKEEIVGHAFLETSSLRQLSHVGELNLCVHLGWQQKGIGKQLLSGLIDRAKTEGKIEKIQLNVRATNQAAIALYKKMGFTEEGRIKHRLKVKGRYIDDLIMGLSLKPEFASA